MINARLTGLAAGEAGRDQTHQDPTAVLLPHHQRSAAVPLAGVLAARLVAGAHHLGIQYDGDAALPVPGLALGILHQGHVNHLVNTVLRRRVKNNSDSSFKILQTRIRSCLF